MPDITNVREKISNTGKGDITLAGRVNNTYKTFAEAGVKAGDDVLCVVEDNGAEAWELTTFTVQSDGTYKAKKVHEKLEGGVYSENPTDGGINRTTASTIYPVVDTAKLFDTISKAEILATQSASSAASQAAQASTAAQTASEKTNQIVSLHTNATSKKADVDTLHLGVQQKSAEITAAVNNINNSIIPKTQYSNILGDAGRFIQAADRLRLTTSGGFSTDQYIAVGFNGSTLSDGGKCSNDSSSHGGSGTANPQTVLDLLTKMGRSETEKRYTPEFHILKITAGSGTSGNIEAHHHMQRCLDAQVFLNLTNTHSAAVWLRVTAGTARIENASNQKLWIDGAPKPTHHAPTVADGWIHVACTHQPSVGYINHPTPVIAGKNGTVIELALPVMVSADVQLPIHKQPLT